MSRPLTQLLPPDLPAGATSPHFGASNPAGVGAQGGHLTSMTNLKSLLQLPIKVDQRGIKDCCEMKGECVCVCARARARERSCGSAWTFLKGQFIDRLQWGRKCPYVKCIHSKWGHQFASVVVLTGAKWRLPSGISMMLPCAVGVHRGAAPTSPVDHELSALFFLWYQILKGSKNEVSPTCQSTHGPRLRWG